MKLAVGVAAVTVVVVTLMLFDRKPEVQSQDQVFRGCDQWPLAAVWQ